MRYEEFVNIQLGKLKKAGLVDPDKIPDMDLYIDQVETFFKNQTRDIDSNDKQLRKARHDPSS